MSDARFAPEDADPAPDAVAAALRDAGFVRLFARADGDSLAAAGLLARALRSVDVPFHVRLSPDPVPDADSDGLTVAVGARAATVSLPGEARPASVTAFAVARELGVEVDPTLALAGAVAAGATPGADGTGTLLEHAERRGLVSRRPGVAVPTADLVAGLAGSTLFAATFSGDADAAQAALAELDLPAELDEAAHRRVASLAALEVVRAPDAVPAAAEAVERALRPYETPNGPFETVGGHADVLDAVAREAPGVGVSLALTGSDGPRAAALESWREHAFAAHRALGSAKTGRYDGVLVARVDCDRPSALATAARLLRDFRCPEPVALVVCDADGAGRAAAASAEPTGLGAALTGAAAEFGGTGHGTATRAEARFDGDEQGFIAAVREAL